jgi:hypothetical protein
MKINYSKCEMVSLNLSVAESQSLASLFGCSLGTLPINYLGISLHWKKLLLSDWNFLIDKIEHKL